MSIQGLNWALSQDQITNSATRFVLLVLCNYANEDRQCYPSRETIAKKTSLSVRTVQEHLNWLVEHKYIKKDIRRFDGKQSSNLYTIIGVQSATSALCPPPQGADERKLQGATSAHNPKDSYPKEEENTLAIAQDGSEDSRNDTDHVIDSSSSPKENGSSAPSPDHARLMKHHVDRVGRITDGVKQGALVKKLLTQFTADECIACYDFQVSESWRNNQVSWATVIDGTRGIGTFVATSKEPVHSYNYVKGQPTQREAIEAEQEMIRQMEAEQKEIEAMGIQ